MPTKHSFFKWVSRTLSLHFILMCTTSTVFYLRDWEFVMTVTQKCLFVVKANQTWGQDDGPSGKPISILFQFLRTFPSFVTKIRVHLESKTVWFMLMPAKDHIYQNFGFRRPHMVHFGPSFPDLFIQLFPSDPFGTLLSGDGVHISRCFAYPRDIYIYIRIYIYTNKIYCNKGHLD